MPNAFLTSDERKNCWEDKYNVGQKRGIRAQESYVAQRDKDWFHQRTSLKEIERQLGWQIEAEIRKRLAAFLEKVVVLDGGCGNEPAALNELARIFKEDVSAGRLELHGRHLSGETDRTRTNEYGVQIHNNSPRTFFRKGIRADIIFDHLGSIFHASDSTEPAIVGMYLKGFSRALSPKGEIRFNVMQHGDAPPKLTQTYPKTPVTDTGHSGFYLSVDGGSETSFLARVFRMEKSMLRR